MADSATTGGGIGIVGLLTLLFITFKLTGVIDWSWWWVLAPIWTGVIVGCAIFAVTVLLIVVIAAVGRQNG